MHAGNNGRRTGKEAAKDRALHAAASRGELERVHALLKEGALPLWADATGTSCLGRAAKQGNAEVVRALLTGGATVNTTDVWGRSALRVAARWGHADCVKVLLDAGASKDLPDMNNWTPLIAAARYGHAEVVSVLVAAGAKMDIVSQRLVVEHTELGPRIHQDGYSARDIARAYGHHGVENVLFHMGRTHASRAGQGSQGVT